MSATISAMYKLSGGCDRLHVCSECAYFVTSENNHWYTCKKQNEDNCWKQSYMSCKFFTTEIKEEEKVEESEEN